MATKKTTAKKMGRPPRARSAATEPILVRVTPEERRAIERAAKKSDKTLAGFMRDAALLIAEKS